MKYAAPLKLFFTILVTCQSLLITPFHSKRINNKIYCDVKCSQLCCDRNFFLWGTAVPELRESTRYSWLSKLRNPPNWIQGLLVTIFYGFHTCFLENKEITLTNVHRLFQSIPRDGAWGLSVLVSFYSFYFLRKSPIPRIYFVDSVPWRRPRQSRLRILSTIVGIHIAYRLTDFYLPIYRTIINFAALFLPLTVALQR